MTASHAAVVKKHCGITLLSLILAVNGSWGQLQSTILADSHLPPDTVAVASGVSVSLWDHRRIVVVQVPDTLVFCYLPQNDMPLDSLARRERFRCVINGSFFNGVRGNASHAGWLSLYGRQLTPLMDDRQLTHVVRINTTSHTISFVPVQSFQATMDPRLLEFQTGPLIIENRHVREDLIRGSINGSTRHARTLLATLDHRRCYFISVAAHVTLTELAATLIRLDIFGEGRLDVINLDGGSSVALFVRDIPFVNTNIDDHLPILLGFR